MGGLRLICDTLSYPISILCSTIIFFKSNGNESFILNVSALWGRGGGGEGRGERGGGGDSRSLHPKPM